MKAKFQTCYLAQANGFPQEGKYWFDGATPVTRTFSLGSYKDYGDRYICRIELYDLLDWFRNVHKIFIIVNPISGYKNGYDSYPIIGWKSDILVCNDNSENSYYMGYPVLEWFVMDRLEEGENVDMYYANFDTYEEALEDGLIKSFKYIKK